MEMHSTYVVKLSRAELERRRLDAARDLLAGVKQAAVARSHHTTRASVSRWNKTLRRNGIEALRGTTSSGRPSHLTEEQWAAVERALREGAAAHGFRTDVWTGVRVQRLIREKFAVEYNSNHLIDVLKQRFNLSWQKPHRVARERDEQKRKVWLETTWAETKKGRSTGAGRSPSSTNPASPPSRSSATSGRRAGRRRPSSTTSGTARK
jgi:putative transposase